MNKKIIIKVIIIITFIFSKKIYQLYNKEEHEKKHIRLLRETSSEFTLFLNKNDEFPINKPFKVLLIGSGARNTLKGGLGSGDVESRYYTTCEEGLENAGFTITSKDWLTQYPLKKEKKVYKYLDYIRNINKKNKGNSFFRMISFPEVEYKLKITDEEKNADIAIYVLARNSGEGMDRSLIKGDIMLTNTEINDILYLNKNYKKFMLVLNVCGVVDLSPVKEVSNILLLSQLGVVTGDILADIILGKHNPSGKLATTWAKVGDYKFINEFGNIQDTNYIEGVYVGYRYFNSAGIKPLYPFGYGKSYTSFEISKISLTNIKDEISMKVKVKNIGKYSGKEVVQIYVSPSQENEDKPFQSLVSFKKTKELKPSKEEQMELLFKLRNVARYDIKKACYILDKGKYIIRVGNSSEDTNIYGYIELDEDIITEKLRNIDVESLGFKEYKRKVTFKDNLDKIQRIKLTKEDFELKKVKYNYEYKINDKLSKLKDNELAYLCVGEFINKTEKVRGVVGSTTKNLKQIKNYLRMADGPAGLRITKVYNIDNNGRFHRLSRNPLFGNSYGYISRQKKISLTKNIIKEDYSKYKNVIYQYATALPIETALAQSFNTDLLEKYGNLVGKEMELFNIHLWLAPAMNIHRNILCGRNFEYFSEDPLISGKMAAAITKGVQSHKNKGTTLKHFTGNNQEINRFNSNSKMSERALREIYLKGFQIAIEESQPHALMTSYNLVNGIHTSQNKQLLIDVLRNEWNFKGLIMTDWSHSGMREYKKSKHPSQNVFNIIKGGNNIMMPGGKRDYNILIDKLNKKMLTRDDLLHCASKVYETIQLLNK